MSDDLSDVIALLQTGTYTVTRRPVTVYEAGRVVVPVAATQWTFEQEYEEGDRCFNGDNVYVCTTGGTSAEEPEFYPPLEAGEANPFGPLGTGTDIEDGTVVWDFFSVVDGPLVGSTFSILACAQPLNGRDLMRLPEGMREREAMALWTRTELRGKLADNDPDSVVIDGDTYEVTTVKRWANLGNYYRAVVVKTVTRS